MAIEPPVIFQKNWPQFYRNGAAVKADFVIMRQGPFDPSAEGQAAVEVYRKTIYPVIDYKATRYADGNPLPSFRSGPTASWPVLDVDVEPEAGHFIEEDISGKRWRITGGGHDPTKSVYTMEIAEV